ncbi:MAG: CBS domain-containing protein [Thermodesulfobacteriota bacterium]
MSLLDRKTTLSRLLVRDAMRRDVVSLHQDASIEKCIRYMIKYKVNAVLIFGGHYRDFGVLSKTDLIGLYYADIPLDVPVREVMNAPLLFCLPDDYLEQKLNYMNQCGVRRLYVLDREFRVVGVLAYSDIVGTLYRLCNKCSNNIFKSNADRDFDFTARLRVRDGMSRGVKTCQEEASIQELIEGLSENQLGAMLIKNSSGEYVGVASKTDVIWAYKHQLPCESNISEIMSKRVFSCPEDEYLANAIHNMIVHDVQRYFVHKDTPDNIVGVLSLYDAARARSGTCKACTASRVHG